MVGPPVFRDFDLSIGPGQAGTYPVSVQGSPGGETRELVWVPIAYQAELPRNWLRQLEAGNLPADDLVALGRWLAASLLPSGLVRDLYQRSLGVVEDRGERLRLRLRIVPPELAVLPWEYAYDESAGDFFAVNPRTALVRYLSLPLTPYAVTGYTPVPLLVLICSPSGLPPLAAVQETRNLLVALGGLLRSGQAAVDVLYSGPAGERRAIADLIAGQTNTRLLPGPASLDALRDALRQGYRVLHYIGHGFFDEQLGGALLLDSGDEGIAPISAQTLARELRGSSTALVVLNACKSAAGGTARSFMGLAPGLVMANVAAVVAMQLALHDNSAVAFSQALYRALADGWPLDAAVTEGRKAISATWGGQGIDWGIPVLFMRSPDGVIWTAQATGDKNVAQSQTVARPVGDDGKGVQPKEVSFQEGGVIIEKGARVTINGNLVGRDLIVVKGKKKRAG